MGMWIELGIFVLVLAWGFWQLHDVKKARAQTMADKLAQQAKEEIAKEKPPQDQPPKPSKKPDPPKP